MATQYFEGLHHAALYSKFRVSPPQSLIVRTLDYLKQKWTGPMSLAIDVGCGSGQSTEPLSPFFDRVVGLDVSKAQISEAESKETFPNVEYRVGHAEELPFEDCSVQLITAGQACHWFDLPKFFKEVNRVLVPGGVLALYCHETTKPMWGDKSEELFEAVCDLSLNKLKGIDLNQDAKVYMAHSKYQCLEVPFSDFTRYDGFFVEKEMSVLDFRGYTSSWSSVQTYLKKYGTQACEKLLDDFIKNIMDIVNPNADPGETVLTCRFDFFLLLGRKSS